MDGIIFLLILIGIFVFYLSKIYNKLNALENRVSRNFSGVSIELEKRTDTINQLKGLARQEQTVLLKQFERLTNLIERSNRTRGNAKDYFEAENEISVVFGQVIQLPEIQEIRGFEQLRNTIVDIEQNIAAARRTYNSSVERFNNELGKFPNGLIAQLLFQQFQPKEFFQAAPEAHKVPDMDNW